MASIERAVEASGRVPTYVADLAYAYAVAGRPDDARRALAEDVADRLPAEAETTMRAFLHRPDHLRRAADEHGTAAAVTAAAARSPSTNRSR